MFTATTDSVSIALPQQPAANQNPSPVISESAEENMKFKRKKTEQKILIASWAGFNSRVDTNKGRNKKCQICFLKNG